MSQDFGNDLWFREYLSFYVPPCDSAVQEGMMPNPQKSLVPASVGLQVAALAEKGESPTSLI